MPVEPAAVWDDLDGILVALRMLKASGSESPSGSRRHPGRWRHVTMIPWARRLAKVHHLGPVDCARSRTSSC